ncbi:MULTISPECIES: hypothetical protein [Lactococcus]|nr:hypothetical protein [Lactococcus petauri]
MIVWKEAVLAEFVLENNLGFAVNSLLDLPEKDCGNFIGRL